MWSSCGPWRTLRTPNTITWSNGSVPIPGTLAFDTIEINDRLAEIKV